MDKNEELAPATASKAQIKRAVMNRGKPRAFMMNGELEVFAVEVANEALRLAALARQTAHDAGQGAEPMSGFDPSKPVWTKDGMPVTKLTWLPAPHHMWCGEDPKGKPWLWHRFDGRRDDDQLSLTNTSPESRATRSPYAAPQPPVPRGQSDGWPPRDCPDYNTSPRDQYGCTLCRFGPCTHASPTPSNAGEDDDAEERFFSHMKRVASGKRVLRGGTGKIVSVPAQDITRLIVLARRGLSTPAQPAGDEVTEESRHEIAELLEAGAEYTRAYAQTCRGSTRLKEESAEKMQATAAALRARTGR